MAAFDIPGRRPVTLADVTITGELDAIARATLNAGYIDNTGKPRDELPRPVRVGWFAWNWRYLIDGHVHASGNAWRLEVAYRRQHRAYQKALADRSGMRDRDAAAELRTDGPAT